MWVCTRVFHVPKRGNAEAEYEDAFFPEGAVECKHSAFRCAVADGASESAFSGLWAQLLVRSFGRRRMRLGRLRELWQRAVGTQPLPWYLEKKVKNGAHAAFMGLRLREGRWRALAVGDSCIFHVRVDELLTVGPIDRAEHFNNSPVLISSKSREPFRRHAGHVAMMHGDWEPGDVFYLATDAMAQWLLSEMEAGRPPWGPLRDLCADEDETLYSRLVGELRANQGLHNDDTTLLQVEVD